MISIHNPQKKPKMVTSLSTGIRWLSSLRRPAKYPKNETSGSLIKQLSVPEMFKQHIDSPEFKMGNGNAFFVCDLGEVYRQHLRWKANLPRVEPFYAVKCNADPLILRLLASLGTGFDCCTKYEMDLVLNHGADPSRIVYAHTCKQESHLQYALKKNVKMMTFDNKDELYKIKRLHPSAQCILRIQVDDSSSHMKLGFKFGAAMDTVHDLLSTSRDLGLDVIGVSFHVGSYCFDSNSFENALIRSREVFDMAKSEHGYDFKFLDIGGGFLSDSGARMEGRCTFEEVAAVIAPTLDQLFGSDIRVIAEPGRYYVNSCFTLAAQVIGRRCLIDGPPQNCECNNESNITAATEKYMYYLNDGIFGSFVFLKYFPRDVNPRPLIRNGKFVYKQHKQAPLHVFHVNGDSCESDPHTKAIVWGHTCAGPDYITMEAIMPVLENGDWVYFEDAGAYSIATSSTFHEIPCNEIIYTITEAAILNYC